MTSLSMRRLIPVCVVVVAALAAAIAPGSASAASDLGEQCSGSSPIKGQGSTFQAPILEIWAKDFSTVGSPLACAGKEVEGKLQGDGKVVTVKYEQESKNQGSGACLHGWGAESSEQLKYGEYPFCGTDEAPNEKQKGEIESHKKGGSTKSLEEIPVLQGAVAVIVHLPAGCLAESEVAKGTTKYKLGRLVFDDSTVAGVFSGTIKTWKALLEKQEAEGGAGSDKLVAEKGKTCNTEDTITPVVRTDHSGTTHIFKSFLEQVDTEEIEMEAYPQSLEPSLRGKSGCPESFGVEMKTWKQVAEACENQRWPVAAKVRFNPTEKGNPGVVNEVNKTESSIGYADLAVAREKHFFSGEKNEKGEWVIKGGENRKGTATKTGEQNPEFWAELQDTATPEVTGFAEPATNGDIEKPADSNCKNTTYTNEAGKKFPPANTREPWNGAKAEVTEKGTYSICGLTYDLALRQYKYYSQAGDPEGETTKEEATSVRDFLLWALNTGPEGGGTLEKDTDYETLPKSIITKSEKGVKELGYAVAG